MTLRETDPNFQVGTEHMAPHLLLARAADAPDDVVLQSAETGQCWTSRSLLHAARCWATALAGVGVARGDHVVTMLPDPGSAICSWLGACFAGAVEAPINPQHRGELLRAILTAVSPRAVVLDARVYADLDPADLAASGVVLVSGGLDPAQQTARTLDLDELLGPDPRVLDPPSANAADTAAVIFTSGTTGPSKGVIVPWAAAYQLVSFLPYDALDEGEALFCPLPMFHLAGKSSFTTAMIRRARYVYRERFSASSFLDDVRSTGCTAANIVGPMLSFLHDTAERPNDADNPLRAVICGPLIPDIEGFKRRFDVGVATCYGMTEIGSVLTTDFEHGPWKSCGRVRASFPWPEIRIVDPDDRDVPPGSIGQLVVRTPNPAAFSPGYLYEPDKTAEAWRGGWFHSGDAFQVDDDGNHYLVDRYSDTIRRRGENVSSFEVESILSAHQDVLECAGVAVPGAHGDDDIVVFVVRSGDGGVDEDALDRWVAGRVPSHMRPTRYRFIEDLPRNATSLRVKKYELRRIAREEDPHEPA